MVICGNIWNVIRIYHNIDWYMRKSKMQAISSVQFSRSVLYDSLPPHQLQHARLPCLSLSLSLLRLFVCWVSDAIQASHPLLTSSTLAFNLSQHQGLFQWDGFSHQVASVFPVPQRKTLLIINAHFSGFLNIYIF